MFRNLVFAIAFSILLVGCGDRWGSPISTVETLTDARPAVPSDSDVVADIQEQFGEHLNAEIESEVIAVDSRTYIVIIDRDSDTPQFWKVTYYLLDAPNGKKEWVCLPEQIEVL